MKKVFLSLVALALVPALAFGAVNVKQAADGTYYNSQTGQKTDSNGNAYTADSAPDRETYRTGSSQIISGSYALAAQDSSAILDVHDYKRLKLLVAWSGAGSAARLAFQIRYHIDGAADTASWFTDVPQNFSTGVATTAIGDSAVTITAAGTATAPGGDEFLCILQRVNSALASIPGRYATKAYNLANPGGTGFFQYISIRMRVLGGGSATANPIKVYLVGSAN